MAAYSGEVETATNREVDLYVRTVIPIYQYRLATLPAWQAYRSAIPLAWRARTLTNALETTTGFVNHCTEAQVLNRVCIGLRLLCLRKVDHG